MSTKITRISSRSGRFPYEEGLAATTVTRAAEASLRRLKIDRIDLYFAHYQDDRTPIEESVRAFDTLVREGKARYVGLSNFTPQAVAEWLRVADEGGYVVPVALQPHYSLLHRRDYEEEYASLAHDANLLVYPYRALAGGFLSGKYRTESDLEGRARGAGVRSHLTPQGLAVVDAVRQIATSHGVASAAVALAWLLHQPTVTAPLSSATTTEQLTDLLAADGLSLTPDELAELEAGSAPYA